MTAPRVRVAPSPTGFLHVGTARTALFNWLYARSRDGTFIVRIDDTDRERSTSQFEEDILGSLRWLGLDWSEGIEVGGPHGTYRQSDRYGRYREVAEQLVREGHAYHDPRSPDELEALRARAQSEGKHPGYYIRRPEEEASSGPIRLAIPERDVEFDDLIRGTVRFSAEAIDEFVILRSDGTPTYHLASTVDDVDYGITHVARGEDLLPSTPKHILLTLAMGATPPEYAHLPLLFGTDGKKLSKRHGATSVMEFREAGFLPDAMFNYLALLGWSLDAEREIFSREEAAAAFDLRRVSKNPAMFDPAKLESVNAEYVRAMEPQRFVAEARPFLERRFGPLTSSQGEAFGELAPLVQERTRVLTEVPDQVAFLFVEPLEYDPESWSKVMEKEGVPEVLGAARTRLEPLEQFTPAEVEEALRGMLEALGIGARKGLQPIRVAVTGSSVSPPLFESIAALGRERTLERLAEASRRL